nr:unnamed protein product [Callosobruchus analis]
MSRYCSIARYKCYLENVKSIKDVSSWKFPHIQDVNLGDSNRMYSSELWNKIMKGFTKASSLQKSMKVLSTSSGKSESENSCTPQIKPTRIRLFKKEFQKAYSSIQRRILHERGILLCSATVSAVNPTSTNDSSTQLASQIANKSPDGVPVEPIPEPPAIPEAAESVSGLTMKSLEEILVEPITKLHQIPKAAEVFPSTETSSSTVPVESIYESPLRSEAAEVLSETGTSSNNVEPITQPPPEVSSDEVQIYEHPPTLQAADVSTKNVIPSDDIPVELIPEPPLIPEGTEEVISQVNALGEPTLASLGLGGYTPVGLVQNCLELLHADLGIPWWGAIAIGTLVIRICLFPLVIIAQRNAAKMNNYLPQMQTLQLKLTEARQSGNSLEAARYSQELMLFMKEKNLNPLKNMVVPLAQMPVFVSFFMALRQMSNVPVDSLRTGGLWWFTDLTLPDQYFILPLITSATLFATIELGTDTAKLSSQNMVLMKYVLRAIPVLILPFTVNFPGAILCYWVSTNFISLLQVGFLRLPRVREYFNIEPMKKFDPTALPIKPKGFREGLKESWTNMKISRELEERKRLDEIRFMRAGKGPIQKTYKYDPTKQVTEPGSAAPMSAKKL